MLHSRERVRLSGSFFLDNYFMSYYDYFMHSRAVLFAVSAECSFLKNPNLRHN